MHAFHLTPPAIDLVESLAQDLGDDREFFLVMVYAVAGGRVDQPVRRGDVIQESHRIACKAMSLGEREAYRARAVIAERVRRNGANN